MEIIIVFWPVYACILLFNASMVPSVRTLAVNRGAENDMIFWLPLVRVFTMGNLSDSFQCADRGKKTRRRIWLPRLHLVALAV